MKDLDPCPTCGAPEGEYHDLRKHSPRKCECGSPLDGPHNYDLHTVETCEECGTLPHNQDVVSVHYARHLVALAARAGHTLVLDHTLLEWDEDFQEWFIGNDIALIWLHYRIDGSTRRI